MALPAELQLGVGQLAAGGDAELQQMIRGLPWRDVVSSGLTFLPCAISLAAEKRKGDASIFADYSAFLAETPYSNAIAPLRDAGNAATPSKTSCWARSRRRPPPRWRRAAKRCAQSTSNWRRRRCRWATCAGRLRVRARAR